MGKPGYLKFDKLLLLVLASVLGLILLERLVSEDRHQVFCMVHRKPFWTREKWTTVSNFLMLFQATWRMSNVQFKNGAQVNLLIVCWNGSEGGRPRPGEDEKSLYHEVRHFVSSFASNAVRKGVKILKVYYFITKLGVF